LSMLRKAAPSDTKTSTGSAAEKPKKNFMVMDEGGSGATAGSSSSAKPSKPKSFVIL
jgi:hypothetical protein